MSKEKLSKERRSKFGDKFHYVLCFQFEKDFSLMGDVVCKCRKNEPLVTLFTYYPDGEMSQFDKVHPKFLRKLFSISEEFRDIFKQYGLTFIDEEY